MTSAGVDAVLQLSAPPACLRFGNANSQRPMHGLRVQDGEMPEVPHSEAQPWQQEPGWHDHRCAALQRPCVSAPLQGPLLSA